MAFNPMLYFFGRAAGAAKTRQAKTPINLQGALFFAAFSIMALDFYSIKIKETDHHRAGHKLTVRTVSLFTTYLSRYWNLCLQYA